MKFLCKIVLCFFLLFLATPTVVCLIDDEVNVSSFYNFSEEEENENDITFNEIQFISEISLYNLVAFLDDDLQHTSVHQDSIICRYKVSIFLPPPDLI